MSKKTKTLMLCLGIFVLLVASSLGIWFLTRKEEVSKGNVLGIAWYDENGTEFTIDTIQELRELAALSEHYNFHGQTIKLGADIVDNEGTATDWENEMPEHVWEPIKNFAGTFDGQGHTISGICGYGFVYKVSRGQTEYCTTGLFTNTQASCVIKDFRLVNSFFYSDFNEGAGSVASNGGGTFDSIYSNATVLTYKQNTGGLIGMLDARGSHTVTNCWFDGELRVEGNTGRFVGGIVGRVANTSGQNKIEHCLNTGTLTSPVTGTGVNMGGLIGYIAPSGRVTIKDSLSVGTLANEYAVAVGSVIGNIDGKASANIMDVYTSLESYSKIVGNKSGSAIGLPMGYDRSMITGYGGYQWTTLDFENYWSIVEDDTPTLKYFAENVPSLEGVEKNFDLAWYNKNESEYILTNMKELYGFTILSRSTDFSEKVVKLGADIVVNEGNAADWAKETPEYTWVPVGTVDYPFAGIFDGNMHSISGLYCNTDAAYSGLFSTTSEVTVIKNLKLMNSFFKSTAASFGSIAGRGRGTFDTIYSNAIVIGLKANIGGMVGQVPGDGGIKMNNCWFDGTVTHTGNASSEKISGGLVGVMYSDSTMSNCLNTGTIDATAFKTPNKNSTIVSPLAGGLVGWVTKNKTLTMSGCLNVGDVKVSSAATAAYGSVVGYVDGSISVTDSYTIKESCAQHTLRKCLTGNVAVLAKENMKGYQAYQWTLLDFDKYWAVVKNDTPILKSFATNVPSLAGVKRYYDIKWYNADKKTYVLDSKEDLYGFALLSNNTNFDGKTIKLGADIVINTGNANDWSKNAPEYKWLPISSNVVPFKGTFDGCMHSISGVYLNTTEMYNGLFGATSQEATVKNLKLTNSYFESSALSFGSIAGRGRGTFDTIYSDAIIVTSSGNVGGLIGQVPGDGGIKMTNCWFDGSVTSTGNTLDDRRTGGLVGVLYSDSTVSNCLNSGDVNATKYTHENKPGNKVVVPLAGGLVGYWSQSTLTITGCLNVGKVLVSDKASIGYGPIIGYRDAELTLKDTYATAESCKSFTTSRINGLVSKVATNTISGIGAYQWTFLDFDKYWAAVTSSTPILQSFASEIMSLAGIDRMIDLSWYEQAKGTADDPYILSDVADLYGFAQLSKESNFAGKTIKLDRDIVVNPDMSNPQYTWTPIGSTNVRFAGTFDGDMHSISGIYLKTNERFAGLFAETDGTSVIKNLSLEDSYIETTAGDCGSIVGRGSGKMDTVKSSAIIISSNARVGGLVGNVMADSFEINNCWFAGSVTATGNEKVKRGTGGLIGYAGAKNVEVTNSLNTAIIDVTAYTLQNSATSTLVVPLAGGLIGQVYKDVNVKVSGCLNIGEVKCSEGALKGTNGYGSVIGYSDGTAKVSETYATTESCKIVSGGTAKGVSGKVNQVTSDSIKGYDGYQWTILDFDTYWAVVLDDETTANKDESGTPILKSFADKVPSLASVDKMMDFSWIDKAQGTEADPYILKDVADLYGFATLSGENDFAGKYVKLGADIVVNKGNATDWRENAPSYAWSPIGSQSLPFAGTFDGDMHSISGIYLNTTSRFGGLFSFTGSAAKIQDLKLKNSYMKTTAADFGSIAGVGDGEFNTIYSEAIIDCSNSRIGGLVGQNGGTDVKMTNCWYSGTITNSATKAQGTGGLVGVIANGTKLTIQSGYFSGVVDTTACTQGAPYAGGWVGMVGMGGTTASGELILKDSLITGSIYQNATNTKGCAAWMGIVNKNAKVTYETQSYSVKEACNRSLNAGENAQLITTVPAPAQRGITTILGTGAQTQMSKLSWGTAWETVHGTTPVLKSFKDEVIDTSWIDVAQGTEADPYILYDRADLYGLAMLSQDATYNNFTGKFVKLGADIVVNVGNADTWANGGPGLVWNSIGANGTPFNGTFNGDMHSISGIYINTTSRWFGLFGVTGRDSVIKNLKLTNSYMKTTVADFGGIAGVGGGEFNTIYNKAIIDCAAARSGGFLGQASGADVKLINCQFAGSITNSAVKAQGTGGFVGVIVNGAKLTMQSCYHSGVVDASACNQCEPWAGGLVGQVGQGASGELIVRDSLITGAVIANATYTKGYGAAFGYAHNKSTTTYEGNSNYFTQESCNRTMTASTTATINGTAPAKRVETNILGAGAQTLMPNLSWGSVWTTVTEPEDGLPVLKTFIDMKK